LHHDLGQAQASQKGRFAALVGPGDDYQIFIVRVGIVPHDFLVHGERQARVAQFPE